MCVAVRNELPAQVQPNTAIDRNLDNATIIALFKFIVVPETQHGTDRQGQHLIDLQILIRQKSNTRRIPGFPRPLACPNANRVGQIRPDQCQTFDRHHGNDPALEKRVVTPRSRENSAVGIREHIKGGHFA